MKKKLILATAGLLAAAAPIVAVPTMNAHADQGDPQQTFRNLFSGKCLYDSDDGFRMAGCDSDDDHQKWVVHVWNDDTRELRNVATGRCLDHSTEFGLRTWPCNKTEWQSWYVSPGGTAGIALRNQATDLYLDAFIGSSKPGASPFDGLDDNHSWV